MTPFHPAWVLAPWLLALLTVGLLSRIHRAPLPEGHFTTIDGLRGHLAFAVFLHHGAIWFTYLRSGAWEAPNSAFFNHLGQSSVIMFFMITAFLFIGRLLDAHARPVDWLRLYVSRVLRLTPLYLVAIAVLFMVGGALTGWEQHVPTTELRRALRHWLFFTIGGADDINGLSHTFTLIAGVTWSLPFEWMFYLLLPTLALLMRRRSPVWLALLTLVGALAIWASHKQPVMLLAFAAGGLAAWLARCPRMVALARRPLGSWLAACALSGAVLVAPTAYEWRAMLALATAFCLIAAGSDLFGSLRSSVSRQLGELAYGIYLLHGLLLFCSVTFLIGPGVARSFTPLQHWTWLTALSPVVVATAWAAFRLVERPSMKATERCTRRIRGLGARYRRQSAHDDRQL